MFRSKRPSVAPQHVTNVKDEKRVPLLESEASVSVCDDETSTRSVALLGCGDCGKSTLFRQMRTLGTDNVDAELRELRWISVQNLVSGTLTVCREHHVSGTAGAEIAEAAGKLERLAGQRYISYVSSAVREVLRTLLLSEAFIGAARTFSENDLHPSWFTLVERFISTPDWGAREWQPAKEDILSAYARTSGVVATDISLASGRKLHLFDTGGQRCERRKWIHALQQPLDAMVCVASLAEYGEGLFEDHHQNRLMESLHVFEDLCRNQRLTHCPIFLVLTKEDMLHTKLGAAGNAGLNVSGLFPDAPQTNDADIIAEYVKQLFLARNANPNRNIHVCKMTVVSTAEVKAFFDELLTTIDGP